MKRKVLSLGIILVLVSGIILGIYLVKKDYSNDLRDDNSLKDKDTSKDDSSLTSEEDNTPSDKNALEEDNDNLNRSNTKENSTNKENKESNKSDNGNKEKPRDNTTSSGNMNNKENIDTTLSKAYPKLAVIAGDKVSVGTTKNGYSIYTVNGVYYIDDIMMVNKTYGLPESYIPVDTKESCVGKTSTCNKCINTMAYEAFNKMKADATAVGLNIYIASGYRPYVGQESIYNRYIKRDGKEAADTYSARPGYSEHQTSYSFDLNSITDSFIKTKEGEWVNNNAYLYGFIIRFPKGKDSITGYKYEPWHLRYVGYDLAKKLYNNGNWLSLEEYFGVDSKYQD